jgi:hypothetical protein
MIAFLIAFYRRHDVTAAVMRHYKRLADKRGDMLLVAVGSEGEASRRLAEENGWDYVEAENSPLSNKWNAGLARVRELDPSIGLVAMGSDDLVTEEWIERCSKSSEPIGLKDMYLVRRATMEAVHWPGYTGARAGESIGAHRFFPRAALDALGWDLWPKGLQRNLDAGLTARLRDAGMEVKAVSMRDAGCAAVGLSGESNLTPWELVVEAANRVALGDAVGRLPDATRKDVMSLLAAGEMETKEAPEAVGDVDPVPAFLERRERLRETGAAPRISLVMIADNRERTIRRAVCSVLAVCDEVVVVLDSRTTDRTPEILRELGATVVTRGWTGFADQRNAAHAIARGAWHLCLDSDDTMEVGNLVEAIERAEAEDADAVAVTCVSSSTPGLGVPTLQPWVLRKGRASWVYSVHNDLVGVNKTVVSSAVTYSSYVGRLHEAARRAIPGLLAMHENPRETLVPPERERAHASFHLARSYAILGDWPEAQKYARACRALSEDMPGHPYADVVSIDAWSVLMLDGMDSASWFVESALQEFPNLADLQFLAMSFHGCRWYMAARAPGRFSSRPQGSLAYAPRFPHVAAMLGFPMRFDVEAPPVDSPPSA